MDELPDVFSWNSCPGRYGHYLSNSYYDFGERQFKATPQGVRHCCSCKQFFYPWVSNPSYWFCVFLKFRGESPASDEVGK